MPKLARLKPREVEKILLRNGYEKRLGKSSHRFYYNPKTLATTVISFHNKEIPVGTLRSIVRQSGLPIEYFMK